MLRLIPPPVHRLALRWAHRARKRWWRWRKPSLLAAAIVASDLDGRVLLIRLSYGTGAWSFPTGGVSHGETPETAARRELREETGCEAGPLTLLGVLEDDLHGGEHTVHVFACRVLNAPTADGREVLEARFFPTHSLPEPLTASTRRRLELWRESQQR